MGPLERKTRHHWVLGLGRSRSNEEACGAIPWHCLGGILDPQAAARSCWYRYALVAWFVSWSLLPFF